MTDQPDADLLAAARTMAAAGLAVIPIKADGTKAPAVPWKTYQDTAPSSAELQRWFARPAASGGYQGLGVVTGNSAVEMMEVEGRAVELVGQLAQLLTDSGLGDLWLRLCSGWMEKSPSGGMHWLFRVDGDPLPNTKLARRPGGKPGTVDVLIETRGAGGFVVTSPSAGTTHSTGQAWQLLAGGPATIPTLSVEERDALYLACSTFDQMPVAVEPERRTPTSGQGGPRPGDDYNAKVSIEQLLGDHGWTRAHRVGANTGWTRPGKDKRDGISATTSEGGGLYVFSTSTEFDPERRYDAFGAYAVLEHGGDLGKAASALRRDGYGAPLEERRLAVVPDLSAVEIRDLVGDDPIVAGSVDGNTALAPVRALQTAAATLAHSDDANGLLLVRQHGDVLRYCADRGRWYAWDGTVWAPCARNAGPAREYAKEVARGLSERNEKDISFKKKTLSAVGISNMLTQAATIGTVAIDYDQLDAHPWELNTPGGIVDLRTGRLGPSDPSRLHTRLTSCTPDWDADRSQWERFLETTFNGDQELISYMQRLVGYSAVGLVGAHVLPYCYGSGGNGKGVFLETCVKILGDYATTAPSGFLMAKNFQGHETELARLSGARMVVCSEVNDDDRFDEARVKQLTGGDTITARFMQQDHFTFTPTHQLWAMGNHHPHVRAGGPSFWRRLRLIPFVHTVEPDAIIDDLQGILSGPHGPAVLSWIVDGAVAYARDGLRDPEAVLAATGAYERDQDTVARFLDDMCTLGGAPHVQTKIGIVRGAYETWCRENGDVPVSAKAFTIALQRSGVDSIRTRSARFYTGIALLVDDDETGEQKGWWE